MSEACTFVSGRIFMRIVLEADLRTCARLILNHKKKKLRPDRERSHVKIVLEAFASPMYAKQPKSNWITMHHIGLPFLSTYIRNLGAMPLAASACMVLEDPYVQLLATLMTEMVTTAFITDGSPLTPAYWMASTNGEALVLAPLAPRRSGLLEGTMRPTMKSDTM